MRIGIDGRALQDHPRGGVGQYAYHLLYALFSLDHGNEYVVWYNAARKLEVPMFSEYPNVRVHRTNWQNKMLNLSMKVLGSPRVPPLRSDAPVGLRPRGASEIRGGEEGVRNFDIFFMPNINFVALSTTTKLIITAHDLSFVHFPEHFSRKTRLWHSAINPRALFNRADHIVTVSAHTKDDLVETYGIAQEKVSVIYPGVEVNSSQTTVHSKSKNVNREPMTDGFILYFGALEPRKNIEGIIEAFELLHSQFANSHEIRRLASYLIIAGLSTPYVKYLKKRIAKSKVRDRVILKENPTEEEKETLYAGASLFVYPSFYEGFGFPPLEAMSYGVPVVASSASSVPEICGDAAMLVNPWDVNEIKEGMRILLEDETLRQNYISAGRNRIREFSWQASAKQIKEIFYSTCVGN